jgi:hypothetical protein
MKRLYVSLSNQKSLEKAIRELKEYKRTLHEKTEQFVARLIDVGIDTAESNCGQYAGLIVFKKHLFTFEDGVDGVIVATDGSKIVREWMRDGSVVSAEVSPLLMAEFGSGWLANVMSTQDYRSNTLGVGQGTFPGQTHAFDKDGWWWQTPDGERHHSIGEAPTYPMYSAMLAMQFEVDRIGREVFGNG